MDISKIKELFTKVEDGLPKSGISVPVLYTLPNGIFLSNASFNQEEDGWTDENGLFTEVVDSAITHWLDLEDIHDRLCAIEWCATDSITGIKGSTHADTNFDSESVAFGYNLAMERILNQLKR